GRRVLDGVAGHACRVDEDLFTTGKGRIGGWRWTLDLPGQPLLECGRWLRHDEEDHVGVLEPAELSALPSIDPCVARLDGHVVDATGDHVGLARELRHPEAVEDVRGAETKLDRLADGDVDVVRGDHALLRVANLPPPLMSDDIDCQ